MGERAAKAKEVIGWATGDREVEAEARVEAAAAKSPGADAEVTEEDVQAELLTVREERGEFKPDADNS